MSSVAYDGANALRSSAEIDKIDDNIIVHYYIVCETKNDSIENVISQRQSFSDYFGDFVTL